MAGTSGADSRRRMWVIPAIVALLAFVGGVARNLVASDLAPVLKPYRPVVWVVFGVALITAVGAAIYDAQKRGEPPAVPWEELGDKVSARARKIRGKLNMPRERFRLTEDGEYVWAGKK